ncbi:hypothetical protein SKAU_G00252950 [Synaphobranchus kaupii]|uniref:Uncharacterized protein n=1 Tax=Synaphobranchus kaupii TaxID=118154 RepID=A0A9Q1IS17_SYNKA|nr:hypothetical protein SKAU_G00252950 [Synaphobranchus kaupii]
MVRAVVHVTLQQDIEDLQLKFIDTTRSFHLISKPNYEKKLKMMLSPDQPDSDLPWGQSDAESVLNDIKIGCVSDDPMEGEGKDTDPRATGSQQGGETKETARDSQVSLCPRHPRAHPSRGIQRGFR